MNLGKLSFPAFHRELSRKGPACFPPLAGHRSAQSFHTLIAALGHTGLFAPRRAVDTVHLPFIDYKSVPIYLLNPTVTVPLTIDQNLTSSPTSRACFVSL